MTWGHRCAIWSATLNCCKNTHRGHWMTNGGDTYRRFFESGKRMGNLIDDLLAFSRIGRAESRMTEVNLQQLVKEVVSEIEQQTKGQDISWQIGPLPVCYGD